MWLHLVKLVFDTRLSVTPLIGHLGCLASCWSVPVDVIVRWRPLVALNPILNCAVVD